MIEFGSSYIPTIPLLQGGGPPKVHVCVSPFRDVLNRIVLFGVLGNLHDKSYPYNL